MKAAGISDNQIRHSREVSSLPHCFPFPASDVFYLSHMMVLHFNPKPLLSSVPIFFPLQQLPAHVQERSL